MKKIGIGGGVMNDRIKFGKHVVALINPECPQAVAQEFFDSIEKTRFALEMVLENCCLKTCQCPGYSDCIRVIAKRALGVK